MDATEGLRERKRRRTRRALQVAALDLLQEGGLDAVTIRVVAERAGVSERTFFNYFPDKATVLTGEASALPDSPAVKDFIHNPASLLESTVDLFGSLVDHGDVDWELMRRRRRVFTAFPQLRNERLALSYQLEEQLVLALVQRLSRLRGDQVEVAEITERASLTGFVMGAAVRHAWRGWLSASQIDDDSARADLRGRILAALVAVPDTFSDAARLD